jgi:Uma2 family endonuclease
MAIRCTLPPVAEEAEHGPEEPRPRLFTVDEYYKMAEVGILGPDERVQLIDGMIIQMPPIEPRHAHNVNRLTQLLLLRVGDRGNVRNQSPVRLAIGAEPEPDVAVVVAHSDNPKTYELRHPTAEETLLVIELADSTRSFDLGEKADMYASHGVTDLWVVDLRDDHVVVHQEPTPKGYAKVTTMSRGEAINP